MAIPPPPTRGSSKTLAPHWLENREIPVVPAVEQTATCRLRLYEEQKWQPITAQALRRYALMCDHGRGQVDRHSGIAHTGRKVHSPLPGQPYVPRPRPIDDRVLAGVGITKEEGIEIHRIHGLGCRHRSQNQHPAHFAPYNRTHLGDHRQRAPWGRAPRIGRPVHYSADLTVQALGNRSSPGRTISDGLNPAAAAVDTDIDLENSPTEVVSLSGHSQMADRIRRPASQDPTDRQHRRHQVESWNGPIRIHGEAPLDGCLCHFFRSHPILVPISRLPRARRSDMPTSRSTSHSEAGARPVRFARR